jgi:hypothetical protein
MVGDPENIVIGGLNKVPCYGVTGSTFASNGCITVASVSLMPAACVAAATDVPVNPDVTGSGSTGLLQLARLGCFEQRGTAIVPPAQGTFGTMRSLLGGSYRNLNLSVTKTWRFRERYSAQFRAEIHNLLNRTQYSGGSISFSNPATSGPSDSTPNTGQGLINGDGGARFIQLGLKLGF